MTVAEEIYQHALNLPESTAREVLDFIEFLALKSRKAGPTNSGERQRKPGSAQGKIWMAEDFNESFEDFEQSI